MILDAHSRFHLAATVDKLTWKHNVQPEEVKEVFLNGPFYRKVQKGHLSGENLHAKFSGDALVLSARDMDRKET